MARHVVDRLSAFPAGTRRVVTVDGVEIAVFNVGGRFHALRNYCPHRGAPMCTHSPTGTMVADRPHEYRYDLEGELIRCPWHGYEFRLSDGRSVVSPDIKLRMRVYDIKVEQDDVVLYA
ncbi:Rieske (2Fe-2S) protein [Amycolatopsis thermoflava]|uniref:Rieske (2Fe-2S) protein n=1 Tax=Amycolatopsis thermoflava TaxID=84480 RepID=UPI0037FF0F5D